MVSTGLGRVEKYYGLPVQWFYVTTCGTGPIARWYPMISIRVVMSLRYMKLFLERSHRKPNGV
jgi:hypothetical protein